jgi:hypothetical protein
MRFTAKRNKAFIFGLKENRQAADSEKRRDRGEFGGLDQLKVPEEQPVDVWIKDLEFPVRLFKQVFRNRDGTRGQRFLVSNDLTLTVGQFRTLYKKRRGVVEPLVREYHKSLKQNTSIGNSPAYTERTQSNHLFAAIFAYVKLEMLKLSTKLNHFAMKAKIYMASMKTAKASFKELWMSTRNLAFA